MTHKKVLRAVIDIVSKEVSRAPLAGETEQLRNEN
jgi:hypothetical protein